jgi:hypothetical protein
MSVTISEVGYTSATTWRGDHEVHKGNVVGIKIKKFINISEKRWSSLDVLDNATVTLCPNADF